MTMIEKVARSLHWGSNMGEWPKEGCPLCMKQARGALTAMLEPTEEMFTFSSFKSADDLYRYKAMIQAALK